MTLPGDRSSIPGRIILETQSSAFTKGMNPIILLPAMGRVDWAL